MVEIPGPDQAFLYPGRGQIRRWEDRGSYSGGREHSSKLFPRWGDVPAGFDAIHDTVHEMAKDEARHGAGFAGLLKRYFGK